MTDLPWMTALEMQFSALRLGNAALSSNDTRLNQYKKVFAMVSGPLRRADAYAWSAETYSAVMMASKTIPTDTQVVPGLLPSSACWWWFDGGTPYYSEWGGEPFGIHGVLILNGATDDGEAGVGIVAYAYDQAKSPPAPFPGSYWTWRYGETYSEMMQRQESLGNAGNSQRVAHARNLSRFVVAACGWLNQRILTTSFGHIERHRRKQLARESGAPVPSDIKVIQLRRSESQPRQLGSESEGVEWSCRWIVNGHWRNQIYANNEHKLIYIMPYVKGPEDRPLKVPTHTVYQVSR